MFANRLAMAKLPQLEYQHVLENYARTLPILGLSPKKLSSMDEDRRNYLLREDSLHPLVRLLRARTTNLKKFNPDNLEKLDTYVPLDYYATCQEHGFNPLHLSEDSEKLGLGENRYEKIDPREGMPQWLSPSKPSAFGTPRHDLGGVLIEGGLPQYTMCAKLGASREDIHKALNAIPTDSRWKNNPLDQRYARVYHPLGMFANLLRGGGNADEFAEHVKQSNGDSAYVSAVTSSRMGGASQQEAVNTVRDLQKTPEVLHSYLDGVRHNVSHGHLNEVMNKLGKNYLDEYVEHRLTHNLKHPQAMNMIAKGGRIFEGPSTTHVRSLQDEDYE